MGWRAGKVLNDQDVPGEVLNDQDVSGEVLNDQDVPGEVLRRSKPRGWSKPKRVVVTKEVVVKAEAKRKRDNRERT